MGVGGSGEKLYEDGVEWGVVDGVWLGAAKGTVLGGGPLLGSGQQLIQGVLSIELALSDGGGVG